MITYARHAALPGPLAPAPRRELRLRATTGSRGGSRGHLDAGLTQRICRISRAFGGPDGDRRTQPNLEDLQFLEFRRTVCSSATSTGWIGWPRRIRWCGTHRAPAALPGVPADPFNRERRVERRQPALADKMADAGAVLCAHACGSARHAGGAGAARGRAEPRHGELRIPTHLDTCSARTWTAVPEHLDAIGAERRVSYRSGATPG